MVNIIINTDTIREHNHAQKPSCDSTDQANQDKALQNS